MPNLTDLTLGMYLNEESNEDFYSSLKAHASSIQVKTLKLSRVKCPTPASSHHLVEALCSMPNLTDLTLGMYLNEESNEDFYSSLKAHASSIQVKTLKLSRVKCPTPASSHHLVEALCSMPNLTDLRLGMYLNEESNEDFYSSLKAHASSIQVKTLEFNHVKCPTSASSHHLVEALCSMPNLTDLTLGMYLNEESNEDFYSSLKAHASSIQVKTLKLDDVKCLTPASSHHLVEALCSMPNLTDLTLEMVLDKESSEDFYSSLKAHASSIQVKTLELHDVGFPTPASSHHLVEALCSMPNLTDLTLGMDWDEEFYCTLKANASSIQVKTLRLYAVSFPTPASLQFLAEALCSMPNLSDLTLYEMGVHEQLCSALKAKASSIQGCFPQIRKGNFRFNGVAQKDFNSFLHTLSCIPSLFDPDASSDLDGSANSGNSNDSDGSSDSDAPANSGNSNDSDGSSDSDAPANSGNSNASDNSADCGNSNNLDCLADMANISVTTDTTLNSNPWVMYTLQEGQFLHQTTLNSNPWGMYTLQEGQCLHQTTLNSMLAIHQMLYVNSLRHTEKVAVVRAGLTRGNLLLLSREFNRMILEFQRSNQSMKSSCYGINRVRQCPSGNTLS
ncbi:uncharacterized protein LOC105442007 [Strongylocentrotus purpuratus]|uniref:Uncharacterized protein n=1 Tax=Strongylocentrotus purpuratus TaxID=7668 RepID=A0A7M7PDJ9_STRPU|nr:uncharacterized protein LOC105442007 [Strongylocentrotus purpuratus]